MTFEEKLLPFLFGFWWVFMLAYLGTVDFISPKGAVGLMLLVVMAKLMKDWPGR